MDKKEVNGRKNTEEYKVKAYDWDIVIKPREHGKEKEGSLFHAVWLAIGLFIIALSVLLLPGLVAGVIIFVALIIFLTCQPGAPKDDKKLKSTDRKSDNSVKRNLEKWGGN